MQSPDFWSINPLFPHATTDSYVDVDGTEIQLTSWIIELSHVISLFAQILCIQMGNDRISEPSTWSSISTEMFATCGELEKSSPTNPRNPVIRMSNHLGNA